MKIGLLSLQGYSEGLYNQNMTAFTVSSELMSVCVCFYTGIVQKELM